MLKLKTKSVSLYVSKKGKPAFSTPTPSAIKGLEEVLNKFVLTPEDESYLEACDKVTAS